MDKLSIFTKDKELTLTTEGGNSLDNVIAELKDINRELVLTRKGHEVATWGEEVEEMEDVEIADIPPKEVDDE